MAHQADEIFAAMQFPKGEDRKVLQKAYDFAQEAHKEEKRKSGEPYIIHPKAIALSLARLGMDRDTIVAGMLHDTIEDTGTSPELIEKEFGKTVRFLVESVTKLSKLKYRGMERHVESLRRLLVATASDIRVIIIKLADRLHNMQTLNYIEPKEKRERIARETLEVYVPIAERLGISKIKTELEDLAFLTLSPEAYGKTARYLEGKEKEVGHRLDEDIKDIKRFLAQANIRSFRSQYRFKSIYSFYKKLKQKEGDTDLVYDTIALRIIVPTLPLCYQALAVIHSIWQPLPGRVKDYIAFRKTNGYQSLHTTAITRRGITVEVQIRTEQMHREAEYGVASHFNYKTTDIGKSTADWIFGLLRKPNQEPLVEAPQWLKDLNEIQKDVTDPHVFEEILKRDFFAERMFVFTPKGDVIDLPVGATPVDFAYAIHSDIGDHMVGAKANGKMISFETELQNGQVIEILTGDKGKPSTKWLPHAKTSLARQRIRVALESQQITRRNS